ncbi:MAG: hypothetical protein V9E89_19360 [Ilumatobacteraceae bacterium]
MPGAPVVSIAAATPEHGTGAHRVTLHGRKTLVDTLAGIPILHLDATLRQA